MKTGHAADTFAALAVLLMGILICAVSLCYRLQQEYLGVALIGTGFLYLVFRTRFSGSGIAPGAWLASRRAFAAGGILFAVLYTGALLVLHGETYHRPFVFFLIVSGMAALVALQIVGLRTARGIPLLLLEIFCLSGIIRWSLFYLFPALHGVDPFYHYGLVGEILDSGYFPSSGYEAYADFPLMHYLIAALECLSAVGLRDAFFVIGIVMILGTLFVFLITRDLFHAQAGLMAALLLSVSSWHILWSAEVTPMTLGTVFLLVLLFLIFCRTPAPGAGIAVISVLIFAVAAVMEGVHVIPTVVLLVASISILAGILLQYVSGRDLRIHLNTKHVAYFGVITLLCWKNAYGTANRSFYEKVQYSVIESLQRGAIGDVDAVTQIYRFSAVQIVLDNLGYVFLISLMLFGAFVVLAEKRYRNAGITLFLLAGVLFAFIYIPALIGSNASLPHRWFLYAYIPASILAALGCWSIAGSMRRSGAKLAGIAVIIFCFSFFMTTSSVANDDSPLYPNVREQDIEWTREYYYDSEISVGKFLERRSTDDSIVTDERFLNIFTYYYGYGRVAPMYVSDPDSYAEGVILLRKNVRDGYIAGEPTGYVHTYERTPAGFINGFEGTGYVRVYSSPNVTAYIPAAGVL